MQCLSTHAERLLETLGGARSVYSRDPVGALNFARSTDAFTRWRHFGPDRQNPDDVDETGECRMVAVPEIRVLPVAHLISRIRALGWSEGFTNPTHPNN